MFKQRGIKTYSTQLLTFEFRQKKKEQITEINTQIV